MIFQQLRAYLAYCHKAKFRNGHGVHSPFMYELVLNIFSAKKTESEPLDKQERIIARLNIFCEKHGLNFIQVKEEKDLTSYKENCIAIIMQPSINVGLWNSLTGNTNTKVTADCWKFGLALAVSHLQKQSYVMKL